MTTDFNDVSTLLDNPTVSSCLSQLLFQTFSISFKPWDFCPSHLQGNSQLMTLPNLNELYASYSCFLSNIIEYNIFSGKLWDYFSLSSLSKLFPSHGHSVYFIHWDSTWNFFTKGVTAHIIRLKTSQELDVTHTTSNTDITNIFRNKACSFTKFEIILIFSLYALQFKKTHIINI